MDTTLSDYKSLMLAAYPALGNLTQLQELVLDETCDMYSHGRYKVDGVPVYDIDKAYEDFIGSWNSLMPLFTKGNLNEFRGVAFTITARDLLPLDL